jgi:hypothetical protein
MVPGRYVESSEAYLVASSTPLSATSAKVRVRLLLSPAHSAGAQVGRSISATSRSRYHLELKMALKYASVVRVKLE